jgi:hypothetical protein
MNKIAERRRRAGGLAYEHGSARLAKGEFCLQVAKQQVGAFLGFGSRTTSSRMRNK